MPSGGDGGRPYREGELYEAASVVSSAASSAAIKERTAKESEVRPRVGHTHTHTQSLHHVVHGYTLSVGRSRAHTRGASITQCMGTRRPWM